jgi:hypothetical protein
VGLANVLNEEKKQQVLALGQLGWSLRRIQQATRIRRETASAYLKAAGIAVRPPSGWGRGAPKPANEVITDSGPEKPTVTGIANPTPNPNPENPFNKGKAKAETSKPATEVIPGPEVITDPNSPTRRSGRSFRPGGKPRTWGVFHNFLISNRQSRSGRHKPLQRRFVVDDQGRTL